MRPAVSSTDRAAVLEIFDAAISVHARVREMDHSAVLQAVAAIRECHAADGKVLLFGNGGSAADAQHMSAELVSRFVRERRALAAIALSTDTSVLTAVGNDYGFDRVFARQIEALGRPGDVAFGISTSGGSTNVVSALETARTRGLRTIALTGRDGGAAGAAADIHINVPEAATARVQEVHATLIHVICELVERALADEGVRSKE
jgi:D-sedoheptulose 7-phosphate isomerase